MPDLSGGGVERMRLALIAAFLQRGYDVTLIVQQLSGALRAQVPAGARLVCLDRQRISTSVAPLAGVLRVLKPAFLISSLDHNNLAALVAGRLSRTRTRVIVCQHNALSAEAALGWRYCAMPYLYRLLAPLAANIVAVSAGVADDMAMVTGIARRRIAVISNPVVRDGAADAAPAPVHPWLLDRGSPVFVFAGRLTAQKNPLMLLEALAHHAQNAQARLIVMGEGPLRDALAARAEVLGLSQRVVFAGFVADPQPWFAAAHALVLCSRYEGFGNVIVEAMACGTPVIATDCPHGPAEILNGGEFGVLVPNGDADALAHAMALDLRERFPATMLRQRAATYDVDSCVARHEALFGMAKRAVIRSVFGLQYSQLDAGAIAAQCVRTAPARMQMIVTPNLDHVRLLRGAEFAAAYRSAAMICPDGFPLAIYGWLRGAGRLRRVTGCDIVHHLVRDRAIGDKVVVAIVDGESTRVSILMWLAARGLKKWHVIAAPRGLSGDRVASHRLGAQVAAHSPHIVLIGLGAPTSEMFVVGQSASWPACWVLCVGQALRIEAGVVRRAPQWLGIVGLEWLWRLMQEPRRLMPRYVRAALWFPVAVFQDLAEAYGKHD